MCFAIIIVKPWIACILFSCSFSGVPGTLASIQRCEPCAPHPSSRQFPPSLFPFLQWSWLSGATEYLVGFCIEATPHRDIQSSISACSPHTLSAATSPKWSCSAPETVLFPSAIFYFVDKCWSPFLEVHPKLVLGLITVSLLGYLQGSLRWTLSAQWDFLRGVWH